MFKILINIFLQVQFIFIDPAKKLSSALLPAMAGLLYFINSICQTKSLFSAKGKYSCNKIQKREKPPFNGGKIS